MTLATLGHFRYKEGTVYCKSGGELLQLEECLTAKNGKPYCPAHLKLVRTRALPGRGKRVLS